MSSTCMSVFRRFNLAAGDGMLRSITASEKLAARIGEDEIFAVSIWFLMKSG